MSECDARRLVRVRVRVKVRVYWGLLGFIGVNSGLLGFIRVY